MLQYPAPPTPDSPEWPGSQVGISNQVTREKDFDFEPPTVREDFDLLRERALRALTGFEAFVHDAVFLGVRVRLFTNSHHLADFWRETSWSVAEWRERTGLALPEKPDLLLYAIPHVPGLPRKAFLSPDRKELLLLNTSLFGTLRARTMALLSPLLLHRGILPVRGSAVIRKGQAHLFLGATGTGKSLVTLRMLEEGGEWLADEYVALRFGRARKDGTMLLAANPDHFDAGPELLEGVGISGEPLSFSRHALDPASPVTAFVSPLERRPYLPTSLCRFDPELFSALLRCRLENIPDGTAELRREQEDAVRKFRSLAGSRVPHFLGYLPADQASLIFSRFVASEHAHAVLDPALRFGHSAVAMSRATAVPVISSTYVHRNGEEPIVAEAVDIPRFLTLLAGATNIGGSTELFCNPARLVDESAFGRSIRSGGRALSEDQILDQAPASLRRETSLFIRLAHAAPRFSLNTAGAGSEHSAPLLQALLDQIRQPVTV